MLADGLNKGAISRKPLMKALVEGVWKVIHPLVKKLSKGLVINETLDDEEIFAKQLAKLNLDDDDEDVSDRLARLKVGN